MTSVGYEMSGAAAARAAEPAPAAAPAGGAGLRLRAWVRGRWLTALLAAYGLGVTAVLGVVLVESDFVLRLERKLGIEPATKEFDRAYRWWQSAFVRSDARARPGSVLFLGDSIMRDLDTSSIARHTINMAIPGDTTARLLKRMASYRSVVSARGVVIGVGNNDLDWRSVAETLDNYREIVALVPPATPLLLVAVLPIDEKKKWLKIANADIRKLNEGVAALCAARPGCRFVDPTARLADGSGNLSVQAHDGGGEHLSATGHEIYWNAVNAAVVNFVPPAAVTPPAQ